MIHIVLTVCRSGNISLYSAAFGPAWPCGSRIWLRWSLAPRRRASLFSLCESWWSVSLPTPLCVEPSRRKTRQMQQRQVPPKETQGKHTYRHSTLFFFYDRICSGGVLSDRDSSFFHQIRSLLRWSNYRYLRQRGTGRADPSGIGWQSQIRLYLYLHIVGNSMPLSHASSVVSRNLGHLPHYTWFICFYIGKCSTSWMNLFRGWMNKFSEATLAFMTFGGLCGLCEIPLLPFLFIMISGLWWWDSACGFWLKWHFWIL